MKRLIASILISAMIIFGLPINAPVIRENIGERFAKVFTTPDAYAAWVFRNFSGTNKTAVFSTVKFATQTGYFGSKSVADTQALNADIIRVEKFSNTQNGAVVSKLGLIAPNAQTENVYFIMAISDSSGNLVAQTSELTAIAGGENSWATTTHPTINSGDFYISMWTSTGIGMNSAVDFSTTGKEISQSYSTTFPSNIDVTGLDKAYKRSVFCEYTY